MPGTGDTEANNTDTPLDLQAHKTSWGINGSAVKPAEGTCETLWQEVIVTSLFLSVLESLHCDC